ncbi:prephenate dehydratase [Actinobacteria bacterium YIM 96077]|uniref:Prephenate dehydratase n=1 Tax=Phytoactinopolyspora halophila TaxID=1981511 RepID=A0A329R316_9ACTN|nr:prephenate dehydratase [Phytoactinopolyspora halophila]AYY11665.1 prephenate dehydratase [Actinobacteria bacterium YIM 96077]RAW17902.1 prephenate dehydratase [Phytoactinopolyspora halophila]
MPVSSDRYAYLGPQGSFAEAAARRLPSLVNAELEPHSTVHAAIDAVRSGDVAGAVVPLENSVEGSVNTTLDELIRGEPVLISAELLLPVTFTLMSRPGTELAAVRHVITHPVAEAQCRTWLSKNLPDVPVSLGSSTSAAAEAVATQSASLDGTPYDAAIAAPIAAEHYGLVALADDIGDDHEAMTRFVLLTQAGRPPRATGSDKTSTVAYIRDDHPGALLEILEQFATRGVNLTRIESRPTGNGMGRYCFVVDFEGHVNDARVGEALMGLRRVCAEVRYLGSYPRADGVRPPIGRGMTNDDFRHAAEWLESLRNGS